MEIKAAYWLTILFSFFVENHTINCSKEKKCGLTTAHSRLVSDCYRMDFKVFPKCLPSNVQVADLSYNRIRKISAQDLERYPNLINLYLMDNLIVNVDNETVKAMKNLESLDLSLNALEKIPSEIFRLPSLTSLYVSQNMNINLADSIEQAAPIEESSLTRLDMSFITEEDTFITFPNFMELPLLASVNITGNHFNYLTTTHFARLCNLQYLQSDNVTADYGDDCDCWNINRWLTEKKVKFTPFLCPISEIDCPATFGPQDLQYYEKCIKKRDAILYKRRLRHIGKWIGIVLAIITVLAVAFGIKMWTNIRKKKRASEAARVKALEESGHLLNNYIQTTKV